MSYVLRRRVHLKAHNVERGSRWCGRVDGGDWTPREAEAAPPIPRPPTHA